MTSFDDWFKSQKSEYSFGCRKYIEIDMDSFARILKVAFQAGSDYAIKSINNNRKEI